MVKVAFSTCYFNVVETYLKAFELTGKIGFDVNTTVAKDWILDENINLT